jgi:hypothetical protein
MLNLFRSSNIRPNGVIAKSVTESPKDGKSVKTESPKPEDGKSVKAKKSGKFIQ